MKLVWSWFFALAPFVFMAADVALGKRATLFWGCLLFVHGWVLKNGIARGDLRFR